MASHGGDRGRAAGEPAVGEPHHGAIVVSTPVPAARERVQVPTDAQLGHCGRQLLGQGGQAILRVQAQSAPQRRQRRLPVALPEQGHADVVPVRRIGGFERLRRPLRVRAEAQSGRAAGSGQQGFYRGALEGA